VWNARDLSKRGGGVGMRPSLAGLVYDGALLNAQRTYAGWCCWARWSGAGGGNDGMGCIVLALSMLRAEHPPQAVGAWDYV